MPQYFPFGLILLPAFAGLIAYHFLFDTSRAVSVPLLKVDDSIRLLSPEGQPRWYRQLETDASPWQYGVIPAITEKDNPTIYEVSSVNPTSVPSRQQQQKADTFKHSVMEAAYSNGWDNIEQARADGFTNSPPLDFLHYANPQYTRDNETLNPEKPEFLMFYPSNNGLVLAGAMFLTTAHYDKGQQLGGVNTLWHFHTSYQAYCFRDNLMVEFEASGQCDGTASRRSPEMLHVWFVDHPKGDYATDMCLPAGVIEGWEGRKSWEAELEKRAKKHFNILKDKHFTVH
ncbi:hypothetical protein [Candidatus Sororendozoicomonas aggregata]|uniref:hypothetical protein n=1 Tax=Candidatus Sororendozoicomonas aggregata TaxID=3073239 RepID=UPI002ED02EC8